MYRIREVDGGEEHEVLEELHRLCFGTEAPHPPYDEGFWWVAYFNDDEPVGFASVKQSTLGPHVGYFIRCGVLHEHRGKGLQQRLIRVRLTKAKRMGWTRVVTDTRRNTSSSNNLIAAGFKLFEPQVRWAFEDGLYWTKSL